MIDPILSLAFSMHSNKGVCALLLGSGVSRSAGIPTGWEIVLDLIRKLAHIQRANCEPDPAAWYSDTFQDDANYSKLLDSVAKRPSERSQLLRPYFEPNEDERQRGVKTPTDAHKAIAKLVGAGYIRVIITTNFDRLMEKALEDTGIVPTLISTPDAVQGALPIAHTRCTVIKVHGDYLDTRIKNTPEELSNYDKRLNALLDRVLDEFGLIISGWSGDWDIALRDAIQRCKSHRFTTYWTIKDDLSETAKQLAGHRQAEIIPIKSADVFFGELSEKVLAIDEFSRPNPLSGKLAVVTLKKYLEEKNEIRIHDMLLQEANRVSQGTNLDPSPTQSVYPTQEEFLRRMKIYEASVETLQAMMCCLGYWGKENVEAVVVKSFELLVESQKERNGYEAWINLRLYPALILLYSIGLAALANNNYTLLGAVFLKPQNKYRDEKYTSLMLDLYANRVINDDFGHLIPGREKRYTPTSDHLFDLLKPMLKEYIPEERQYEDLFDRFEFLQSLVIADLILQIRDYAWAPIGRWGWKYRYSPERSISTVFANEMKTMSEGIPGPVLCWFGNSLDRLAKAKTTVDETTKEMRFR